MKQLRIATSCVLLHLQPCIHSNLCLHLQQERCSKMSAASRGALAGHLEACNLVASLAFVGDAAHYAPDTHVASRHS
jgi:hypothetical protein